MGIEVKKPLGTGTVSSNINIFTSRVGFGNDLTKDSFERTSVDQYITENYIKNALLSNQQIKVILKEMNAPAKLNLKELEELSENHLKKTQEISAGIISNLPKALKQHVDIKAVKDAAYLHDIGKVLIPSEILNKKGKLTDTEKEIMHRHSELGYEILKNSGLDNKTLNLIKYHHQNMSHSGYPKVSTDFFADLNLQILTAADKYSALLEQRVYKSPLNNDQALAIIYKDVAKGNLHPFVFKALKNYTENLTLSEQCLTPKN